MTRIGPGRQRRLALIVGACLLAVLSAGAVGAVDAGPPAAIDTDDGGVHQVDTGLAHQVDDGGAHQVDDGTNDTANNDTLPPHRNPEEFAESGDAAHVRAILGGWLAADLEESAISIDRQEYETARQLLGDDYDEMLSQYVVLEEDTDDEESASGTLEETQSDQQELATLIEEFDDMFEEYERAREAGETERARELARELLALAEEIEALGGTLDERYDLLEAFLDVDLTQAKESTQNATDRVAQQTAAIAQAEFTETNLRVEADDDTVAFDDPTTIRGTLETENGTPVADEPVRLIAGDDVVRTTTDANGSFAVDYRPLYVAPGTEPTVEYRPPADAEYLGATAPLGATVQSTDGTLTFETTPDALAWGDDIVVDARLTAGDDDTPVSDVPLALTLHGQSVAGTSTATDGSASLEGPLPSDVPSGERTLVTAVDADPLAVSADPATVAVDIESTATTIDLDANATETGIDVSGGLIVAEEQPLPDREIQLSVDGETVETVRTDADGAFETTLAHPADVSGNETVTVEATFDGGGTVFEDATAVDRTTIPPAVAEERLLEAAEERLLEAASDRPLELTVAIFWALVMLALVGGYWWRRRRGEGEEPSPQGHSPEGRPGDRAQSDASGSTSPEHTLLELARDRLDAGDQEAAVRTAFASVRRTLGARTDTPSSATHWEFYRNCVDAEVSHPEALRSVTEAFERATFDPNGVENDAAARAIDRAGTVLNATREGLSGDASPNRPGAGD